MGDNIPGGIYFDKFTGKELVGERELLLKDDFFFCCWIKILKLGKYGMIASRDICCEGESQFRFEILPRGRISLSTHDTHMTPGYGPDGDPNGYRSLVLSTDPVEENEWTYVGFSREKNTYKVFINDKIYEHKVEGCVYDLTKGPKKPFRVGSRVPPSRNTKEVHDLFPGKISKSFLCFSSVEEEQQQQLKHTLDPQNKGAGIKKARR